MLGLIAGEDKVKGNVSGIECKVKGPKEKVEGIGYKAQGARCKVYGVRYTEKQYETERGRWVESEICASFPEFCCSQFTLNLIPYTLYLKPFCFPDT